MKACEFIPPEEGSGKYTFLGVERGFCVGCYDIFYLEDTTFRYTAIEKAVLYRLVFSFSQPFPGGDFYAPHFLTNNKTAFSAINFRRLAFLPKQKYYRSLEFLFSKEWLLKNCQSSSEKILSLVQLLAGTDNRSILEDLLDDVSFENAKTIATELEDEQTPSLHLKSGIFNFVDLFFQKTLRRAKLINKSKKTLQHSIIGEIEKSLSRFQNEELPNINALAKEFNIGSSTLKRQFKLIYKKSIYHYYLEQKMAAGKTMLEEPNASVSAIAYKLGYQKINSFSKIFKKHYGMLPSEVIPNGAR
jgi:AraC-like DNA-binding protein